MIFHRNRKTLSKKNVDTLGSLFTVNTTSELLVTKRIFNINDKFKKKFNIIWKSFKTAKCEMYSYFNAFELFSNVQLNETRGD